MAYRRTCHRSDSSHAEQLLPTRPPQPPGAWTPQAMIPYDAFGLSGSYNRWKWLACTEAGARRWPVGRVWTRDRRSPGR